MAEEMTRDRFLALKRENTKKIAVFEKVRTEVDKQTGKILSEKREVVNKTSKEPDFIKIYYETMLAFNQIHGIPIAFVLSLSQFIEWTNEGKPMYVTINKRIKKILQEDCGVKVAQIERYISHSVKNGLLFRTEYRGVYEVNPFMIAKGKWESIQELQCKFNFVNGKWVREIQEKAERAEESGTEGEPVRLPPNLPKEERDFKTERR